MMRRLWSRKMNWAVQRIRTGVIGAHQRRAEPGRESQQKGSDFPVMDKRRGKVLDSQFLNSRYSNEAYLPIFTDESIPNPLFVVHRIIFMPLQQNREISHVPLSLHLW